MTRYIAVAAALAGASVASAAQQLQIDLNALGFQAQNSAGAASSFGGLAHTGSVQLTAVPLISVLAGVSIDGVNQNFVGTLTNMSASILLTNGNVTGGTLFVEVNGTDTYTAQIATAGYVETYIGGGYTIQGLTFNGAFNSNVFGNVNVTPWNTGGLFGSFLQFNFNPNAAGAGFADMDVFVNVIPLPPAAYAGLTGLGVVLMVGLVRRRK
jgi:hypothetical protein